MSEFKIESGIPISRIEVDFEDLTGQRFGRLVVIEEAERRIYMRGTRVRSTKVHWLCRCDCGREKIVEAVSLRRGHSNSCGCLSAELTGERGRGRVTNIVEQRFGRLIVLGQNGVDCRVRCDCGREKTVHCRDLISGKVDSCGCLKLETLAERQRAKVMQHRKLMKGAD